MEVYTMNKRYAKLSEIDYYQSGIWTERVAGNADFQLTLPALPSIIRALSVGTRVGCVGSPEVMMVDKQTIKNKLLTVIGTSLTQKLNHRFVHLTQNPWDKSTPSPFGSPGYILQWLVYNMTIGGDYLSGVKPMGFGAAEFLKIPDFTIGTYDDTLDKIVIAIQYGQLFDVLKGIADSYKIGQRIELHGIADVRYKNWLSVDHTSGGPNSLVRFSPELDNFGDTTEVVDGSNFKTMIAIYPSGLPPSGFPSGPGLAFRQGDEYTGFDLRADMVLADDLGTGDLTDFVSQVQERAQATMSDSNLIAAVDGTIGPNSEFVYGRHYNLGDIVEVQGDSGITQPARVTEYIRSHDSTGEKAYPTLIAV